MKKHSGVYIIDGDYEILKFKDRNKRLLKIWAMIIGVEVLLLGAFCFVVYKFVMMSNIWC